MKQAAGVMGAIWVVNVATHVWLWRQMTAMPELCSDACWWQLNVAFGASVVGLVLAVVSLVVWRRRKYGTLRLPVAALVIYVLFFLTIYRFFFLWMEGVDVWWDN